jgi:DNA-directed RNA polymerase specialized sigma24 family protein
MPISIDVLNQARKFRREALVQVLAACYPAVYRMAHGLSGREDVARNVIRFVMARGVRQAPRWKNEGDPERWFDHHTVLMWRRAAKFEPDPRQDMLVQQAMGGHGGDSPGYVAFVRALRHLPPQQREAFILHAGEGYDDRRLGIAMDCSREAAGNHLAAARRALMAVSGEQFDAYADALRQAYVSLAPREELLLPAVQKYLSRHLWPRRIRRAIKLIVALAVVGGLIYAIWWIKGHVEF